MGAGDAATADGYIDSPANFTLPELTAVVEEAHAHGSRVAAHATSDRGIRVALDAGVDSIEHGYSIRPEVAAEMAERGVFLSPTFTATEYVAEARAKERGPVWSETPKIQARSFENCLAADVRIAFGTDVGGFPWTEIPQANEFRLMTRYGMSQLDAIRSATVENARLLHMDGEVGVVAAGAFADLIALRDNPLDDISALERVDFVMKGGVVVHQSAA
jgi:imidazolonepropionase-like amidohydrolase